jgi:hypothetical protein
MSLDYATLDILRRQHPAWRLLLAEHAALMAGFSHKTFMSPNVRMNIASESLNSQVSMPANGTIKIADLRSQYFASFYRFNVSLIAL